MIATLELLLIGRDGAEASLGDELLSDKVAVAAMAYLHDCLFDK